MTNEENRKAEMSSRSIRKKSTVCSLKPPVCALSSDLRPPTSDRGFTLLEVLVAMGILMLIVLMMATLFHSSTAAWTSGLRQTEMSIQARSVISLIQRDVSQAVVDGSVYELDCRFEDERIDVFIPGGIDNTNRVFRKVSYELSGDVIRRREWIVNTDGGREYGDPPRATGAAADLIGNVDEFIVTVPQGGPYTTNLPAWVGIELTLSQTAESGSGFKVFSMGRDGQVNPPGSPDDDDVRTWRE